MKTRNRIDSKLAFVMATVMAVVFCGTSAMAADLTWDGGGADANWSTGTNWVGDVAPGATGDNLIFSGIDRQTNTNDALVTSIWWLTLGNSGWNIDFGATRVAVVRIYVTGSSTITGDTGGNAGQATIDINFTGSGDTLTIPGDWYFARFDNQTLNVNGAGNTLILGSVSFTTAKNTTKFVINTTADVIVNGPLTGNKSTCRFTKSGNSTLTLNGVSTYNFETVISAGTLELGGGGSIGNIASLSISAGATFDVSAQSTYTLSTNLTASGIAASPATIKGDAAGTVSLGGNTVTLNWGGASSGVVSDSPPLTIADAELVLNNDPLIINVTDTALGEGVYTLISTTGAGSISGSVISEPDYGVGLGQDPSLPASVQSDVSISGNSVILTIAVPPSGTIIMIR